MNPKKAQIQMGETIAILVVFFFLIVIGFVFYVNIAKTKITSDKEDYIQLESVNVLKKVLSLPELQCTRMGIADESCMDIYKLEIAQTSIQVNNEIYFDVFGFSTITIQEIYPSQSSYTLYDSPLEKFSSKSATNTPISLLNPAEDTNSFGIVTIITYS